MSLAPTFLLVLALCFIMGHAFVVPNKMHSFVPKSLTRISMQSNERVDVVLIGVGDLRTDDHQGLARAIQQADSQILPLAVLDSASLSNIPGAIQHTLDTAAIVSSALTDLQGQLQRLNLNLSIEQTDMPSAIQRIAKLSDDIHIHVCDLDMVDNEMGYGPLSQLRMLELPENVKVHSWNCRLREEPWKDIAQMTDSHPSYSQKYNTQPLQPLAEQRPVSEGRLLELGTTDIPSPAGIAALLRDALQLDEARCRDEQTSGLYATHWGGLSSQSIGESSVSSAISAFVKDCAEDDQKFVEHQDYVGRNCKRNEQSLEHAAISWMMKGNGKIATPNTGNLIAGESMARFLTAPLMLGTLSPRRLWHSVKSDSPFFTSPLKTIAETREWHKILAAKNMFQDSTYRGEGDYQYAYWRWQGFLCRYAKAPCKGDTQQGVLLVHGFGASGSQWEKAYKEMENDIDMGLAPDLIGFGQSEKPGITYTQYLWESFVGDFVKEIAIGKKQWKSFIIGGNSIGGYTSMGTAADDTVKVASDFVSSRGAPGTGRCAGVALMNSAGQLQTKEDVEKLSASGKDVQLKSIAEITITDSLPNCSPLPRPVSRVAGIGLLYYLRPRIQSICQNLYPTNPAAVDSALCESILRDSLDPGAVNVMISGSKLPPPRTANELLGANFGSALSENGETGAKEGMWGGPVLIAQGMLDPLNDAQSRAATFGSLRKGVTVTPIDGGHCPHDELPADVAKAIVEWATETTKPSKASVSSEYEVITQ